MAELVRALGGRLVEARITASDGRTIYASAIVDGPHGRQVIDARPSDALNLALRMGAPIRVAREALSNLRRVEREDEPPCAWA